MGKVMGKVMGKGGRFVLELKAKKDAFSCHACHAGIEGKTERIYYSAGTIIFKSVPASWLCMNCRSV